MPTLLGLCGIAIPATVEGTDRSKWLRQEETDADRPVLITCVTPFGEWTRGQGGREYRGLRTKQYTFVRSLVGPWLLFDNQADPYQQHNLAGNPQYAAVQERLDFLLNRELAAATINSRPGECIWKNGATRPMPPARCPISRNQKYPAQLRVPPLFKRHTECAGYCSTAYGSTATTASNY